MNDNDKIYMEESRAVLIRGEARENVVQPLLRERQLVLYVNGREETSFSCTPERIEELILGYLLSEGKIESLDEVTAVSRRKSSAGETGRKKKERVSRPFLNRRKSDNISVCFLNGLFVIGRPMPAIRPCCLRPARTAAFWRRMMSAAGRRWRK